RGINPEARGKNSKMRENISKVRGINQLSGPLWKVNPPSGLEARQVRGIILRLSGKKGQRRGINPESRGKNSKMHGNISQVRGITAGREPPRKRRGLKRKAAFKVK
ncbi:hypothetical protein V7128_17445, partial [Neobacillus vireti]|uniref:hypothetical protein n=1 Tax=Neobacillus vireti TaxID=220686 RepID=UPI002FFF02BC